MKNNKKIKGFTLTELIIVIVIIALLAAVLLPTYAGLVTKAKDSNDTSLVKMLNDAMLDSEYNEEYKHDTFYHVTKTLEYYGFKLEALQAKSSKNTLVWNQVTDRFYILSDDGTIDTRDSNPDPNDVNYNGDKLINAKYTFWVISNEVNPTYSTYYTGNDTVINTTKGFDAGENKNITAVTYSSSVAQNAIIHTYSSKTTLTVIDTNTDSHIKQYGDCGIINATVAMNSMEINGTVGYLDVIEQGHIVVNGRVELVSTTVTNTELVLVEGHVEHAHVEAGTVDASKEAADKFNSVTGSVAWDYDSNGDQSSTTLWTDVYHHTGYSASDSKSTDTGWTVAEGKDEVASVAVTAQIASTETTEHYVARIGTNHLYTTFDAAMKDVIDLKDDDSNDLKDANGNVITTPTLTLMDNIKLDAKSGWYYTIKHAWNLVGDNYKITVNGLASNSSVATGFIHNEGLFNITVKDIVIDSVGCNYVICQDDGANANFYNVSIYSDNICVDAAIGVVNCYNCYFEMEFGKRTRDKFSLTGEHAVDAQYNGTLNLYECTIKSDKCCLGTWPSGGTINAESCTIISEDGYACVATRDNVSEKGAGGSYPAADAIIKLKDCSVTGKYLAGYFYTDTTDAKAVDNIHQADSTGTKYTNNISQILVYQNDEYVVVPNTDN